MFLDTEYLFTKQGKGKLCSKLTFSFIRLKYTSTQLLIHDRDTYTFSG